MAEADSIPPIYGLMAEFTSAEELLTAAQQTYAAGYRRMDAYTPFPVEGLSAAIGFRRSGVPLIMLIGGIVGGGGGYLLQYYVSVINYPLNVGGRPLHSWPAFIPVTFELTVLVAALAGAIGMLALNGLPKPYHPVFNVERFQLASKDRFFLCIEATDDQFDQAETRRFLESLKPLTVSSVEH